MTNAIEQAKREMYGALEIFKHFAERPALAGMFESQLEAYLELLRQDHEALHETARKWFEDLQVAEAANQELASKAKRLEELTSNQQKEYAGDGQTIDDLESRLAKMTEERDAIQLRLHAVDHTYNEQQSRVGTSGQCSGDRGASEAMGGQKGAIQGAAEDIRKISDAWAMTGRRAKKSMRYIAGVFARPEVYAALEAIEKPTTCMHSFFAIGDDQMKCTFCGVWK